MAFYAYIHNKFWPEGGTENKNTQVSNKSTNKKKTQVQKIKMKE